MIYTIPSPELYITIAKAYVSRGLTPEQAREKVIAMKGIIPIKGKLYKIRYNRIMFNMHQLLLSSQSATANK